jgi:cytochrome d ubiquinol oxidase subunit II
MKTEGEFHAWSRCAGRFALIGVSICIASVSIWTPLASSAIAHRWFDWPNVFFLLPLPVLSGAAVLYAWYALGRASPWKAFAASVCLFAL